LTPGTTGDMIECCQSNGVIIAIFTLSRRLFVFVFRDLGGVTSASNL